MLSYPAEVQTAIDEYDVDLDTIVLKNQPIAREGVLPYRREDGTVIRKFKRWKDLKKNIGKRVPIIFEHPDGNNGRRGLFNNRKRVEGVAVIKRYKNFKMLAADMYFRDDFKPAKGYSMGYPFKRVVKSGRDDNGHSYDEVQAELTVDHVALTNNPREPTALQSAWDASITESNGEVGVVDDVPGDEPVDRDSDVTGGNDVVNKYTIGYDSYRCFVDLDAVRSRSDIEKKIRTDNPKIEPEKLGELVETQFTNQFRLEGLAHLMKTGGDTNMAGTKNVQNKKLVESEDPEDMHEKKKKKKTDSAGIGGDQAPAPAVDVDAILEELATIQSASETNADSIQLLTNAVSALTQSIAQDRQDRKAEKEANKLHRAADSLKRFGYTDEDLDGWDLAKMEGAVIGHVNATKHRTQLNRQAGRDSTQLGSDSFGITGARTFNAHNLVQSFPYDKDSGRFIQPRGGAN
jgi:hypothetical protein